MEPIHVIARRLYQTPDDEATWLVFADALLDRGDARGEWLTLQHRWTDPSLTGRQRLAIERRMRETAPPSEEELLEELDMHAMWWVINVHLARGFILGLTLAWRPMLTLECLDRVAAHPAGQLWTALSISGLDAQATARLATSPTLRDRAMLDVAQPKSFLARMGPPGARTLATTSRLARLDTLHIGGNDIGATGALSLVGSDQLQALRTLDLAANALDDPGMIELAGCSGLQRLVTLGLADNPIGPRGLQALLASPWTTALERLDLRGTSLTARSAEAWAHLQATGLRTLLLDETQLKAKGVAGLAAAPALSHVQHLSLAGNELEDAGATAISEARDPMALRHLDLSHNHIGPRGMTSLLRAGRAQQLRTLVLDHNRIGPRGLRARPSTAFIGIEDLRLASNGLGDSGVQSLARWPFTRLRSLKLHRNHIGDAAAIALARSTHLGSLTHLDLRDNDITDKGAVALANAQSLGNLVQLDLRQNRVGPRGVRAIERSGRLTALSRFRR
ncbi:MAG: hypothetical protein AAGA48_30965 [Myxococcota bacterium]